MGWGFYGYCYGSKRKKKTKSYSNWFERLSSEELKALLKASSLPFSGSKAKQMERLLECPTTKIYQYENTAMNQRSRFITVEQLKSQCRDAKLSPSGRRYDLILRLVEHHAHVSPSKKRSSCDESTGSGPPKKKRKVSAGTSSTPAPKPLVGEALEKRTRFRLQKLNKQISNRLEWKSSFKNMNGGVRGARVEIDCPEKEVFLALFDNDCEGGGDKVKKAKNGKLSRSFQTDDDICNNGLNGKTYRYGASAELKAPATVSLQHNKLSFSFKFTVS